MIGIAERRYIGIAEVAKIFNVTPRTVNRWAKTGKLKGCRIGHQWRFLSEDIEAFAKPAEEDSPQQ